MIRKFECWDCHKVFMADDKDWVECPHCHSDNVEYYHLITASTRKAARSKKLLFSVGAMLLVALGGYLAMSMFNGKKMDKAKSNAVASIVSDPVMKESEYCLCGCGMLKTECGCCVEGGYECICQLPPDEYPVLGDCKPVFDEQTEMYDLQVVWQSVPANLQNLRYVLTGVFDDKEICVSDNGKFAKIPPSTEKNTGYGYRLHVYDAGGKEICESREVLGFIKQVKVQRISAAAIKELITDHSKDITIGGDEHLSPDMVVLCPRDPMVQTLQAARQALDDEIWESFTVSDVEYDDMNRVVKVVLDINQ